MDWTTIADELPIEGADIEFKTENLFLATREMINCIESIR